MEGKRRSIEGGEWGGDMAAAAGGYIFGRNILDGRKEGKVRGLLAGELDIVRSVSC